MIEKQVCKALANTNYWVFTYMPKRALLSTLEIRLSDFKILLLWFIWILEINIYLMFVIYIHQNGRNRGTFVCVHAHKAGFCFSVEKDAKMYSYTNLAVTNELLNSNKEKLG